MLLRHMGQGEKAARLEVALNQCPLTVGQEQGITAQDYTDRIIQML